MHGDFRWSGEKEAILRDRFGFGFEKIVEAVQAGHVLDDIVHPNSARYSHQRVLIVEMDSYAWAVPYVIDDGFIFLKTMFPDRRLTRRYNLKGR
jgi:hypothetical protein